MGVETKFDERDSGSGGLLNVIFIFGRMVGSGSCIVMVR